MIKTKKVVKNYKPRTIKKIGIKISQDKNKKVVRDNAEVIEILQESENNTSKLCRMSNGTTTWIENEYFV